MWWKGNFYTSMVGVSIGPTTMENNIEIPQKIKNTSIICFSNSTSGFIRKGNENSISTRYMHSCVYHSIIPNSQNMETIQMSISRSSMPGSYLTMKSNGLVTPAAIQKNPTSVLVSERSQTLKIPFLWISRTGWLLTVTPVPTVAASGEARTEGEALPSRTWVCLPAAQQSQSPDTGLWWRKVQRSLQG